MGSDQARYVRCLSELEKRNQQHVLRWWGGLETARRQHLLAEIEAIQWERVEPLIESHVRRRPAPELLENLQPAPFFPLEPNSKERARYDAAIEFGRDVIRAGRVAAFTVAGGQGTRLGFDGPKGSVTITPVREKSLFQVFAETILAVRERYSPAAIPWYIMTNPSNHQQTLGFLEDHEHFGLPRNDIFVFVQGVLPSFDFEGRMLMADRHRLALAPDGHGGSLGALATSGALDDMRSRNIDIVSYFQVDNPLVKPFDPLFIGLHCKTESEMSTKVSQKTTDFEKVGNLCIHDGRLRVIEYSDLPEEVARSRNDDGSRRFDVGNLAIHLFDLDFVERIASSGAKLPYHRADKKITWIDENGFVRTPSEPNGVKLETFVFDALAFARKPLLLEIDRAEEYAPVKNPSGIDSVESAKRAQVRRAARWLEDAGVIIPRDQQGAPLLEIEIAPAYALEAADVKSQIVSTNSSFKAGETVYIS